MLRRRWQRWDFFASAKLAQAQCPWRHAAGAVKVLFRLTDETRLGPFSTAVVAPATRTAPALQPSSITYMR